MTHVSIIGTGNMSQGISGPVTKGGNTVELPGHSDTGKPVRDHALRWPRSRHR